MGDTCLNLDDLNAIRSQLRGLRDWADDRLDDECCDRQLIAEHMTAVLNALLGYETPPRRPF